MKKKKPAPKLSRIVFTRVDNDTFYEMEKRARPESMALFLRKIIRESLANNKC